MNLWFTAMVKTTDTPAKIARVFRSAGWQMRKAGWYEYECSSAIAEVEIESSNPVLVHGSAADGAFEAITALLRAAKLPYTAEVYDGEVCLAEHTWAPSSTPP